MLSYIICGVVLVFTLLLLYIILKDDYSDCFKEENIFSSGEEGNIIIKKVME